MPKTSFNLNSETLAAMQELVDLYMVSPMLDNSGVKASLRLRPDALAHFASGDWLEAAGFAGWIEKPIRIDTFADQVRRYCEEATG